MVHDILPTVSQLNKFDGGKRTCPSCRSLHEDRDHIIRCPSPARNVWRHELLTSLSAWCIEHHTQPLLQQLLLDSLRHWMYYNREDAVPYSPICAEHSPTLSRLIQSQTRIGWRQLFNGRFSQEWSNIQDSYLYCQRGVLPPLAAKLDGEKWQTQLITFLWGKWHTLWLLRNDALHGKDAADQHRAEQREIRRRLEQVYDSRSQMEPSVQELLCLDIQTHLQRPTWVNKNWLSIHTPLVQASIRRVRVKAIQGVRSIRTYFGPR